MEPARPVRLAALLSARNVGLALILVLAADLQALERVLSTPPDWAARCRTGQPLPPGRVVPGVHLEVRVHTPAPVAGDVVDLEVSIVNRGRRRLRLMVPQEPRAAYVVFSPPGRRELLGGLRGLVQRETEAEVPPNGRLRLSMRARSLACAGEGKPAAALAPGFYDVFTGVRLASRTDRGSYLISGPVGVVLGPAP